MREIKRIFVHCSFTKPSMDIGVEEIRDWHVNGNGWSDIGYHDVIRRDGSIEPGRSYEIAGAHASGNNADSIGVCLVGGMNQAGEADSNFTLPQLISLKNYIDQKKIEFPGVEVFGHRDVSTKQCPCIDIHELLK